MGRGDNKDLETLREALNQGQSACARERMVAFVCEKKSRI